MPFLYQVVAMSSFLFPFLNGDISTQQSIQLSDIQAGRAFSIQRLRTKDPTNQPKNQRTKAQTCSRHWQNNHGRVNDLWMVEALRRELRRFKRRHMGSTHTHKHAHTHTQWVSVEILEQCVLSSCFMDSFLTPTIKRICSLWAQKYGVYTI